MRVRTARWMQIAIPTRTPSTAGWCALIAVALGAGTLLGSSLARRRRKCCELEAELRGYEDGLKVPRRH